MCDKIDQTQMLKKIMEDSTRWDRITGAELKRRIAKYLKSETADNLISVISCLRLAEIFFLRKKEGNEWTTPYLETPDGTALFIFTARTQIKSDKFKEYKVWSNIFSTVLGALAEKPKYVVINPDTQCVPLPTDAVDKMIREMDTIESHIDEIMEKGINAEHLDAITFERFFGRRVECETASGKYSGEASEFDVDEKGTPFLLIDMENGEQQKIYQADVISIKDITPYGEL